MKPLILNVDASTVSSKVRASSSVERLRSNDTRVGKVLSGITSLTFIALSSAISTTIFMFKSRSVSLLKAT